jgi:DNA primase
MLWNRETTAGRFDTPERRAGLEARLQQVTAAIANESVRKYYRQDLEARVGALFRPASGAPERGGARGRQPFSRGRQRNGGREPSRFASESVGPVSSQLAASPIVRGSRAALPPREALIVFAVVNHPWILDHHSEELAELEFLHADADRLRRAILEAAVDHEAVDTPHLRAAIEKRGLGTALARVETVLRHGADWPARDGAAAEDVRAWWTHVVTLHRRSRTLNKELRDAEHALGEEPSEANLNWLRDVQGRLSALEGTEAAIEGFGALSGRPVRGF